MSLKKTLLLAMLLSFAALSLTAQQKNFYNYQDLSHVYYSKQKDSIKKNWACPAIYSEKTTQKKYKEFWDDRTNFLVNMIDEDDFVYDEMLINYVQEVVKELVASNKILLPATPLVLIDRSPSVNAYAMGKDVIAVNLGLLCFVQSREELALVIAHELSHNILQHADNAMKQKAEWLTSDEYKNSVNAVLDSKYERLTRLRKVLEGFSFSRSRHQRYRESDADSMAIILLKNSKMPVDPQFFMRLDSSDMQYRRPLKQPLNYYFTNAGLPFEEVWAQKRTRGLSSRAYAFRDTTTISDSLKTHPDCKERYARNINTATPGFKPTPVPAVLQQKANKMLLWNMYCNSNLTACLYRILLEKDKGNNDEWYDFMTYTVFTGLNYADQNLRRFNAIGVTPKEYLSKEYYQLQTVLEQMPREQLNTCSKNLHGAGFWSKMSRNEITLKQFMYSLVFDAGMTDKAAASAAKDFAAANPDNPYLEFVTPFGKK